METGEPSSITTLSLLQGLHDRVDIHRQSFHRRRISGRLRLHSRGEASSYRCQILEPIAFIQISTGVSNGNQGFGFGNKQRNGESGGPYYTFCCTGKGRPSPVEPKSGTRQEMWLLMGWPCLEGDAGILRVPGSVCVLLLLPLRRHRLLRAAH